MASKRRRPIDALPILSDVDRQQVVGEWNASQAEYPRDATVHELVEAQVARTPDAVALVRDGATLTFAELDARATRLARHLRALGVGPEVLVGLSVERSFEMIVGMLAVLKAGGAYVPLDPDYPDERIAQMVADAKPPLLLTEARFARRFDPSKVVLLDRELPASEAPLGRVRPDNAIYVIFTSGSTGRPKGVVVTHRSVINYVTFVQREFGIDAHDVVLQLTAYSFDAAVPEIWLPLFVGARIVLPKPGGQRDTRYVAETLSGEKITMIEIVPSLLDALLDEEALGRAADLRHVFCGGERVSPSLVRRFQARSVATIVNVYGPTEVTVDAAFWRCPPSPDVVPIGRPVANCRLYVLDRDLAPVPLGVTGELFVSSDGLARGYLGRGDSTAEKFVPDPFGASGGRMYRTGDLVRRLADGSLEFLSRTDDQVKIRGFRVEPGEIEAVLREVSGVRDAVVLADDGVLAAYVIPLGATGDLRTALRAKLPEHMVPLHFVEVREWPLSPTGKIDRKALPKPVRVAVRRTPPSSPTEVALARAWCDLLHVETVGLEDEFFDLGGHSLLVTRLVARIRRELDVEVSVRTVFESPALGALATAVDRARSVTAQPIPKGKRPDRIPLSSGQRRLWILEQFSPGVYQSGIALRVRGAIDVEKVRLAFNAILERHESLRTTFSEEDGEPFQVIGEHPLDFEALRTNESIEAVAARELARPFDLENGPLLRVRLVERKGDSEDRVLLVSIHHISFEAWSADVLVEELSALYAGRALPELPIQYADYALWQRASLEETIAPQIAYWKTKLAGMPVLELPTDSPRPAALTPGGAVHVDRFPDDLTRAVRELGRSAGVTPYVTMLAALELLLGRASGQNDFGIGTVVANRARAELEPLIGFLIETVVIRADLSGDPTVRELLRRTRETVLQADANKDVPFDRLLSELETPRSRNRTPLFDVIFSLETHAEMPRLGDADVSRVDLEVTRAPFDWTVIVTDDPSGIVAGFYHRTSVFHAATAARMAHAYQRILRAMTQGLDGPVSALAPE